MCLECASVLAVFRVALVPLLAYFFIFSPVYYMVSPQSVLGEDLPIWQGSLRAVMESPSTWKPSMAAFLLLSTLSAVFITMDSYQQRRSDRLGAVLSMLAWMAICPPCIELAYFGAPGTELKLPRFGEAILCGPCAEDLDPLMVSSRMLGASPQCETSTGLRLPGAALIF